MKLFAAAAREDAGEADAEPVAEAELPAVDGEAEALAVTDGDELADAEGDGDAL